MVFHLAATGTSRKAIIWHTTRAGRPYGGALPNAYYGIHRAFKRAGLYRKGKLTHEIRRAVASTMLLSGTPIHVVKEILGHSTIKTTELYAFTNEEAKKEAVKNALV